MGDSGQNTYAIALQLLTYIYHISMLVLYYRQ